MTHIWVFSDSNEPHVGQSTHEIHYKVPLTLEDSAQKNLELFHTNKILGLDLTV